MKGNRHPTNDLTINSSGNESIRDVIDRTGIDRRRFLGAGLQASIAVALAGVYTGATLRSAAAAPLAPSANGFGGIGFDSIAAKLAPVANSVDVPLGYKAELLVAWGDPIVAGGPAWLPDASQSAADQEKQYGMHNDGMHYFPFATRTGPSNERGLLCVNNEYTHEEILFTDGQVGAGYTIAKCRKSQAAHGVSILEVRKTNGKWGVVRTSSLGRRITSNTPMRISGPAAGHALLQSKKYAIAPTGSAQIGVNNGFEANGTINNCAHGYTPWGTYLTCEENWNGNFGATGAIGSPNTGSAALDAVVVNQQTRFGVTAGGFGYRWHTVDPRLDVSTNPLETNLFGWVVEIDPFDPASKPVKRTALGRFKHESAQVALSYDAQGIANRIAYYQGDNERNEYIYKFVATQAFNPRNRAANRELLDSGILYVAKFLSTPGASTGSFRGEWIALVPDTTSVIANGQGGFFKLRELPQFAGASDTEVQALILIKTRQAADAVGATMMDRPEWAALRTYTDGYGYNYSGGGYGYDATHPLEVYCTLTNNNRRGGGGSTNATSVNNPNGTSAAGGARPPVDVANPRPDNDYGHIIRWREDGNYVTATGFEWDLFALCGDTATTKTLGATYQTANLVDGVAGIGPVYQGNIVDAPAGSADLGAPDGLWFDQFGRLWIQTDQAGNATGDFANIGANCMACADPNTKEIRRFLTSPNNCEVTGVVNTPDGKSMFVGIQHPGEDSVAANPTQFSNWPQSQFGKNSAGEDLVAGQAQGANIRPRSSVLVITRDDGGVIGA